MFYSKQDLIEKIVKIIKKLDLTDNVAKAASLDTYKEVFSNSGGFSLNDFQSSMVSVAIAIIALFFLMQLVDLAMSEQANLETFLKAFVKLIGPMLLVYYAADICNLGFGISNWIGGKISSTTSSGIAALLEKDSFGNYKHIDLTGYNNNANMISQVITLAVPDLLLGVVAAILNAAITFICFSRVIELGVRAVFMPIGIALMSEDGFKGAGGRYIKRFIALCAQGPVIILITSIYSLIVQSALVNEAGKIVVDAGDMMGSMIPMLGCAAAAIGVTFKSIGIVNDIFGA